MKYIKQFEKSHNLQFALQALKHKVVDLDHLKQILIQTY